MCLKEGDTNMSYLHRVVSYRRRSNVITPSIVVLSENASVLEVKGLVTEAFKRHFQSNKEIHVVD